MPNELNEARNDLRQKLAYVLMEPNRPDDLLAAIERLIEAHILAAEERALS